MTEETHDVRAKIVSAAATLLASGGRDAVSTRAVSAAAGVQAPTIYRQFGDMKGLLDAVAVDALNAYLRLKRGLEDTDDPIADLRRGWDNHVEFGIANPAAYLLIYSDPATLADRPAKREGDAMLLALVDRVAKAGRLALSVPHAANMISAACRGVTLSVIATPVHERDLQLSHAMRDAVHAAIMVPTSKKSPTERVAGANRVAARAVALRAVLTEAPDVLTTAERQLIGEWLDRLAERR